MSNVRKRIDRRRQLVGSAAMVLFSALLAFGLMAGTMARSAAAGSADSASANPGPAGVPFGPRPFDSQPLLPEHAVHRVSAHVYVIEGFPNVGIIVGERGTLAVDTGLGARNGAIVARAARMLSTRGQQLYLTTTHYHPEHASGQAGFPKNTVVIRNRVQQTEADAQGARMIALFASRSPVMHSLLAGASIGPADILFEHQAELDLGGVHARLLYFGPAHTRGDELIFVPEDSVLLPGDVVQNQISPNFTCDECSPASWLAVLDQVAALHPRIILPDHGGFGGEDLIAQERGFLTDLQNSAVALERRGVSAADAGRQIGAQFASRYAGWQNLRNVPHAVQLVYGERR